MNPPFSRKQTVAVYRNMENILTNPACVNQTESPQRHVTLPQGCEMCFQETEKRKHHPCFRHTQQHQEHLKRSEAPKLHPAFTPSFLASCEKCAFRVWEELKLESPAVLSSADHKQPSTAADRRTRIFFLLLRSWCDQPGLILVSLV